MLIFFTLFLLASTQTINDCLSLVRRRDALLTCGTLIDTNNDQFISPAELTTFLSSDQLSQMVFAQCDLNHDGFLTVDADWNNATSSCGQSTTAIVQMCDRCQMKGWTFITRKTTK